MSCTTESHAYVIFGATGNLATIKLLPALYQLHCLGYLAADEVRKVLTPGRRRVVWMAFSSVSTISPAVSKMVAFIRRWVAGSVAANAPEM